MMSFFTWALLLFALHELTYSSGLSLVENVFNEPEEEISLQQPKLKPEIRKSYFTQKIDHFNKSNEGTWQQKFYKEDHYYASGGPVYLMLEYGHILSHRMKSSGYWYSHGKKNSAMLFYISHRYHDFLQPTDSAEMKNLIYLNTSQALEDYAAFIKAMNKEYNFPKGTKWIIFGSSFSGSLAAWMRTKYPDLVHGAVASSAPVLAQMDSPEYLNNVGNALAKHSKKCRRNVAQANTDLDESVKTPEGRKYIGRIFDLCEPLDGHHLNVSYFSTIITKYVSEAIENDFKRQKVNEICQRMNNEANNRKPIERYSSVLLTLRREKEASCFMTNFHTYADFLNSTHRMDAFYWGRYLLYQACNEFGWFHTSEKNFSTFSKNLTLNYSVHLCSQTFGSSFNKLHTEAAVTKTNKLYGGLKINTPRTMFINGNTDPWKFAQITNNKLNKNVDVITIKGGSHSTDMRDEYSTKKEVVKAIEKIEKKLDAWLKE